MRTNYQTQPIYEIQPRDFIPAIRNYDIIGIQNLIARCQTSKTIHSLIDTFFQELQRPNYEKYINFCFENITGVIEGYGIPVIFYIDSGLSDTLDALLSRRETREQTKRLLDFCLEKFSFDDSREEISNLAGLWKKVNKGKSFPFRRDWNSPFALLYVQLQYILNALQVSDQLSPESKRDLCAEINELDLEDFDHPDFNFLERETAKYYSEQMLDFLENHEETDSRSDESEPRGYEYEYEDEEGYYQEDDYESDPRSYESEEEDSPHPEESRFRTSFELKEILKEDEGLTTEYKKYFWKFKPAIDLALSKTICGFLNRDGGRIYIGVDDSNVVVGIKLTSKERDEIKLHVLGLVRAFEPSNVNTSQLLSIVFLPIKDPMNHQKIPGLFVMKIIVKPGDSSELYSISKEKCGFYQRNDSQTVELNPAQIFKIHTERQKNLPKKILESEFIDPKPESLVDLRIATPERRNYKKMPSPSKQRSPSPRRFMKKLGSFPMNKKGKFSVSVHIKGLPKGVEVEEAEKYLCLDDFQRDVVNQRIFHERGITNSGEAFVNFNNERAAESYVQFVNSYLQISAFFKR